MTENHEGIFVESMSRNHFCPFLTKWKTHGRRTKERKNRDGGETPTTEFYLRNTQPNICLTNVVPGEEWAHLELTKP